MIEAIKCLLLLGLLYGRRKDALLVEAIICLSLLSLLLVRRKILRLYWADATIIIDGKRYGLYTGKLPTYHTAYSTKQKQNMYGVRTKYG